MKKYIVLGLSIGVGATLAAVLVLEGFHFYNREPAGWNRMALVARKVVVSEGFSIGSTVSFIFTVNVENTTTRDIPLPKSARVMLEAKGSRALSPITDIISLSENYVIPAGHVFEVYLVTDAEKSAVGLREDLKDYDAIVIFDDSGESRLGVPVAGSTKYELDIPIQNVEWSK